jgi:hypothetical protein
MPADKHDEPKLLSADDMRRWLGEEVRNVLKECELRVRDATGFTTAYAAGELSPKEAHKRLSRYEERWHDALEGIYASSFKTDDAILAAIDKAERSDRSFLARLDRRAARHRKSGHDL